jgi:hypothetical protein
LLVIRQRPGKSWCGKLRPAPRISFVLETDLRQATRESAVPKHTEVT